MSVSGDTDASSPIVWMPIPFRYASVFGPTPHSFLTESGHILVSMSFPVMIVRPSGFCMSDAIFARSLLGAMPMEQVSPVAPLTLFLISSAISSGGLLISDISRNASSIPTASIIGEKSRRVPIIISETLEYSS